VHRFLRAGLLSVLLGMNAAAPGAACSCLTPPPPVLALIEADAVFEGVVTAIEVEKKADGRPDSYSSADLMRVIFRVLRSWKEVESAEAVVFTARMDASCGYEFAVGQRYLVYASTSERGLVTGACTRTTQASRGHTDFRDLGAAKWEASP
jgi:hypothetical protein